MSVIWQVSPVGLEVEFFLDVDDLLANSPYTWYVLCGYRSKEESDRLYKIYQQGGPRAAPGGLSPHNIGEAIDVVPDGDKNKAGLQMDWNESHPAWQWLFEQVAAHPRLHSGRSFDDSDHIESVKFTRTKMKDKAGVYYIPAQNLHYLTSIPTNVRTA
jgi:hypothetical protein